MIKEIITLVIFLVIVGSMAYSVINNHNIMTNFCKSHGFDNINFNNYCVTEDSISSLKVDCKSYSFNPIFNDCRWHKEKEIIEVGK